MLKKYIYLCICSGGFSTKTGRQSVKCTKKYVQSMDDLLQYKTH